MAQAKTKSRRLSILIAVIAAVAALGVIGPYVYIHYIEDDAPDALSVDSSTNSTAPAANETPSVSTDGAWTVGANSQAGYRVKEVLFGQDTEAVGRTSDVTGDVVISGTQVTEAKFDVDLASVTSDQSNRDNQFRGRIMSVSKYPTASFELTKPIDLGTTLDAGKTVTVKATGNLTTHGVTKEVTIDLSAKRTGNAVQVSGSIPITFADYDIPNPSFGPAQTGDTGTIEVLLNLTKST